MPLSVSAALTLASANVSLQNATLDGRDQCPSGSRNVADIAALVNVPGRNTIRMDTWAALMGSIRLDWVVMNDTALAFDYELPRDPWPDFARLAPEVYPTIRYEGDVNARSGRGLLVVTGRVTFDPNFQWDGLIVAGSVGSTNSPFTVTGAVLTGFDGAQSSVNLGNANVRYNSCSVARAAAGMAVFSPIPNTWWESVE